MKKSFKKMALEQVQEELNSLAGLAQKSKPSVGWIQTIRKALGMTTYQLANKMKCSQSNIISMENREKKNTISLKMLEEAAQAMNCRLVYCFVPQKPLDEMLKEQAHLVAKRRLKSVSHSMSLEKQGLSEKQLKQQKDDVVQELLQGDPKHLWENKE